VARTRPPFISPTPTQSINLIYIRAAVEAATGQRLKLEEIRDLLVEEGLITAAQAKKHAQLFRGYSEYYDYDENGDPVSQDSREGFSNEHFL
jgi:hypothetical protein